MILDWIKRQAQARPDSIAMCTSTMKISYKQLMEITIKQAALLYQRKPKKVATVAIYYKNNEIEFITYFLAAASIGWKAVPIDPKLPGDQIEHLLRDCNPDFIVTETSLFNQDFFSWGKEVLLTDQIMKETITVDKEDLPTAFPESIFYHGYTSGTSGQPKGFLRTQHSWTESFQNTDQEYKILPGHSIVIAGSLVHSLFLYGAIHALTTGATVHLLDFTTAGVMRAFKKLNAIVLYVVPTMLESLVNASKKQWQTVHLIISSGAKWNTKRRICIEQVFPLAECIEFYGASELSFVSILHHRDAQEKSDSVGRPFTGVDVTIRDTQFSKVKPGEIGTLYVKSTMLFKEYYQSPEATNKVFHGSWATAGDLAFRDSEGYIYLVGRSNQMIISGGLNIYPEEVERVIQSIDTVRECAVVGFPDKYWGERVIACVKFRSKDEDISELKEVCRERLPRYKCPKEYVRVDNFPYTVSGKIARKKLMESLKQVIVE